MKTWKMYLAAAVSLLNAIGVGIASTYSSTATESMKTSSSRIKPNDIEVSWIGSILALGALCGGLIAGCLADKFGRKGVMIFLSFPSIAGWLLIAYASSLPYVFVGRFLSGLCCGLICVVVPMYLVEISTPDIRGKLGAGFQLFICIGIITISILGKFLTWDWLAISGAVTATISLICMIPMPESPGWLITKGNHAEAVQSMHFLFGVTVDATAEPVTENMSLQSQKRLSLYDLSQPTIYKPILFSITLMFFQQFSGSNAVLYYTVLIFKQAKTSLDPVDANIFVALTMLVFTFISSIFMDIAGRKKFFALSSLLTSLSIGALGTYIYTSNNNLHIKQDYNWVPLLCLLVYIATFSLGLGPIPWLMMSEMTPMHARAFVCSLGTALSWTFAFIITKSFVNLEYLINDYGTYWMYSGFCLLACLFSIFLLPETKGKTLEEIGNFFANGQPQLQRLQEAHNVVSDER